MAGAGFSSRKPSGGRLSRNESAWPCAATGSVRATPALPMLLPPYASLSLLISSS